MSLNTALRQAAVRVIHATGQAVTIRRVTIGTYNTSTGVVGSSTVDQELQARFGEYTDRERNGTILAGDRKVFVAASDLTWIPAPPDRLVTIDEDVWEIISVKRMMAQADAAFYVLQVRA